MLEVVLVLELLWMLELIVLKKNNLSLLSSRGASMASRPEPFSSGQTKNIHMGFFIDLAHLY